MSQAYSQSDFIKMRQRLEREQSRRQKSLIINIKKQFDDLNNCYGEASRRQDQIYATDALLQNLRQAAELNDPQIQYEEFRQKRVLHQQQIMAKQQIRFDIDPLFSSLPVINPYNISNTAQLSHRSKKAMRPYDQFRYQNKMGMPSSLQSNRSKTREPPVVDEPPIVENNFGRELFTTDGHETIRELGAGEETPSSSEKGIFDAPFVDDFSRVEKSYLSKIQPKQKIKNVTGVNFYKNDIKSNFLEQQIAHRKIQMLAGAGLQPSKFSKRDITKSVDTYVDTYRSKNKNKQILGFEKNSFPMIRPEKEEIFSTNTFDQQKMPQTQQNWTNPSHMKKLDKFLKNEEVNRNILINNVNDNIQEITHQLQSPVNFKKFYWKPDLQEYGFATNKQINNKMEVWKNIKKQTIDI